MSIYDPMDNSTGTSERLPKLAVSAQGKAGRRKGKRLKRQPKQVSTLIPATLDSDSQSLPLVMLAGDSASLDGIARRFPATPEPPKRIRTFPLASPKVVRRSYSPAELHLFAVCDEIIVATRPRLSEAQLVARLLQQGVSATEVSARVARLRKSH